MSRVTDHEVEAAAKAAFLEHEGRWAAPVEANAWDILPLRVRDNWRGEQRAALEAAEAVREQAAAKLAEETGPVVSLIYRGLDDAVAPEQVPMVPLSVVAELRASLEADRQFQEERFDDDCLRSVDIACYQEGLDVIDRYIAKIDAAFPQLKE